MKLNARELATVLHGLRMVQEQRETGAAKNLRKAGLGCTQRGTRCEHFDDAAPLSDREIDALCERINVEEYDPASAE